MAESHVITGLVAKRSELSGESEYHQSRVQEIKKELVTLDAAIRLFKPDYAIETIPGKEYRRKNKFFKNGECNRLLMDVIREANGPISTTSVIEAVAKHKGLEVNDIDRRAFSASIFTVLKRLQGRGVIREESRIDSIIQWVIA